MADPNWQDLLGSLGSAAGSAAAPNYDAQVLAAIEAELGLYSPGSTAANDAVITPNSQLTAAQMSALGQLGSLAGSSGLDPQAEAQLSQALLQSGSANAGNMGSIVQNAQARGQGGAGGAGATLGSELQSAGSMATGNAQAAQQAASAARNRALQALGEYGQYASGLQQQGLNTQQQNYYNQMGLNQGQSNAFSQLMNYYTNATNRSQQQGSQLGNILGQMGGGGLNGLLGGGGGDGTGMAPTDNGSGGTYATDPGTLSPVAGVPGATGNAPDNFPVPTSTPPSGDNSYYNYKDPNDPNAGVSYNAYNSYYG